MISRLLIRLIRLYQLLLSPYFGNQCRFTPTCSHYAQEAIAKYGSLRGSFYSLRRLLRCHPWCRGGYDPVP